MALRVVLKVVAVLLTLGVAGVAAAAPEASRLMQAPPVWQQVNTNGFGDPQTVEVSALERLVAASMRAPPTFLEGARIFRSQDGLTWDPVTQPGFGEPHDIRTHSILDLVVFNGRLYASTGRSANAGQIWRSLNGSCLGSDGHHRFQ
jgi:hypothetical protein